MKLKTLVSTMAVLGLVSTSAYAALPKKPQASNTQVNNLTRRVQRLEAIVNRNQDNASDNPQALLGRNWFNNVTISGEIKPVFGWSNRASQYIDGSARSSSSPVKGTGFLASDHRTTASLNTAEVYMDAKVNSFTKLHAALDYDYDPSDFYDIGSSSLTSEGYIAPTQKLFFSEASVEFANLAKSGLYANVGKQFFNFGSYQHDSITTPMTEMLSKINGVGATVGYVSSMGFNVDGYVANGLLTKRQNYVKGTTANINPDRLRTFGASAGYTMKNRTFGLNFQLGYLNNMAQTIYVAHSILARSGTSDVATGRTFYGNTPGLSAHIDLSSGPFSLMFDYVGALERFAGNDLATGYTTGDLAKGAKPQATFTQFAYNFNWMGHKNTPYVAYQTSDDAVQMYDSVLGGFYMPKSRITLGYMYNLGRNVNLNLEYDHDKDYKNNDTQPAAVRGSGRTSENVNLGVDVKF